MDQPEKANDRRSNGALFSGTAGDPTQQVVLRSDWCALEALPHPSTHTQGHIPVLIQVPESRVRGNSPARFGRGERAKAPTYPYYLVADSTGYVIDNPKHAKKSAKKLARAQRKLAKCKRGSHRRKKAKHLVARTHERIANQRKDTLHKASHKYVKHYQTIVIEDLKPANMIRNHSLAFAIADASWGMFRQFLENKAEHAGRKFIAVAPHSTSQKCSSCGESVQKSLSVRTHVCPYCGYLADRDENAARNILHAGLRVLARTEPSLREREGPVQTGESPLPLKREAAGL